MILLPHISISAPSEDTKNDCETGQSNRSVQTAAETQDGIANLHRSLGSCLYHTAVALASIPGSNTNRHWSGCRINCCADDVRDNADFEMDLPRLAQIDALANE